MRRAVLVMVFSAAVVAAADLGMKIEVIAERGESLLFHERSLAYTVAISVVSVLWCGSIVILRSSLLALPGGLVLGAAAGNVASWALWPSYDGTPNTFFVGDSELGLAFNLADAVVVAAVLVLLPVAVAVFAVRNRDRLREPLRLRA